MSTDRIRDQNRLRAMHKRQREREVRIDVQIEAIANEMPEAWRDEWRGRVRRNRARAERAKAEVEKMLPAIPESGRDDFIARNRLHTKVWLAELRNDFVRDKGEAEQANEDWRTKTYVDDEIAADAPDNWDDAPDNWDDRYPGSPPLAVVEQIAARFPRPERIDTDLAARQRTDRLQGCWHLNLKHPAAAVSAKKIFYCEGINRKRKPPEAKPAPTRKAEACNCVSKLQWASRSLLRKF